MWRLWQWIDSAFPTGAYAHSAGLEAWAHLAPRGADAEAAIAALVRSQAQLSVPFVRAAFAGEDPRALDAEYDACLWGESANRASRAQGLALVEATRRSFGLVLEPVHHAVAFGALARHFTDHDPSELYLFAFARAAVSAAVRLNVLGPFEGQGVLSRLDHVAVVVPPRDQVASAAPWLDLVAEQHPRLHTRLFSS
jgi:urease accessory protein